MSEEIEPGLGLSDSSGGVSALSRGASMYLSAKGQKQGPINGSSTTKGQEHKVELLGVEEMIVNPTDIASGQPSGRRMHFPVHVAFKLDKSGPKWCTAIDTNENLTNVEIDCWSAISKESGIGQGTGFKLIYKIELKNANLSEVRHFTAVNGELCMALGFTYEEITVTWADGNLEGNDRWLSAAQG
jgi:type VI secretion system secreted protein Hcp